MTFVNAVIQIRNSNTAQAPNTLNVGELGYSYVSNTLFIGDTDGGVINVVSNVSGQAIEYQVDIYANGEVIQSNAAADFINTATINVNVSSNEALSDIGFNANISNIVGPYATIANGNFSSINSYTGTVNSAIAAANAAEATQNTYFGTVNTAIADANSAFGSINTSLENAFVAFGEAANSVAVFMANASVLPNANLNFLNSATVNLIATANLANLQANISAVANANAITGLITTANSSNISISYSGSGATIDTRLSASGGTPGGINSEIQFNNSNTSFAGSPNLTWANATSLLTVNGTLQVTNTYYGNAIVYGTVTLSGTPGQLTQVYGFYGFTNIEGSSYYIPLATLPYSSESGEDGNKDSLTLDVTFNSGWVASGTGFAKILMGNRGGFNVSSTIMGNSLGVDAQIVAYEQSNSTVVVYMYMPASTQGYFAIEAVGTGEVSIPTYVQSIGPNPSGTLIYGSGWNTNGFNSANGAGVGFTTFGDITAARSNTTGVYYFGNTANISWNGSTFLFSSGNVALSQLLLTDNIVSSLTSANVPLQVYAANTSNLAVTYQSNGAVSFDTLISGGGGGEYQVDVYANGTSVLANANLNFVNTATVNVNVTANGTTQANINLTANLTAIGIPAIESALSATNSAFSTTNTAITNIEAALASDNAAFSATNSAISTTNSALGTLNTAISKAANSVAVFAANSLVLANANLNFLNTSTINLVISANTTNVQANITAAVNANAITGFITTANTSNIAISYSGSGVTIDTRLILPNANASGPNESVQYNSANALTGNENFTYTGSYLNVANAYLVIANNQSDGWNVIFDVANAMVNFYGQSSLTSGPQYTWQLNFYPSNTANGIYSGGIWMYDNTATKFFTTLALSPGSADWWENHGLISTPNAWTAIIDFTGMTLSIGDETYGVVYQANAANGNVAMTGNTSMLGNLNVSFGANIANVLGSANTSNIAISQLSNGMYSIDTRVPTGGGGGSSDYQVDVYAAGSEVQSNAAIDFVNSATINLTTSSNSSLADIQAIANLSAIVGPYATTVNSALSATNSAFSSTNTAIADANTGLGTINTNMTAVNSAIGTLNTYTGTVNSALSTTNTTFGTINTTTGTMNTATAGAAAAANSARVALAGSVIVSNVANLNFLNTATANITVTANETQSNISPSVNANAVTGLITTANSSNIVITYSGSGATIDTRVPTSSGGGEYQVDVYDNAGVILTNSIVQFVNSATINASVIANGSFGSNISYSVNSSALTVGTTNGAVYSNGTLINQGANINFINNATYNVVAVANGSTQSNVSISLNASSTLNISNINVTDNIYVSNAIYLGSTSEVLPPSVAVANTISIYQQNIANQSLASVGSARPNNALTLTDAIIQNHVAYKSIYWIRPGNTSLAVNIANSPPNLAFTSMGTLVNVKANSITFVSPTGANLFAAMSMTTLGANNLITSNAQMMANGNLVWGGSSTLGGGYFGVMRFAHSNVGLTTQNTFVGLMNVTTLFTAQTDWSINTSYDTIGLCSNGSTADWMFIVGTASDSPTVTNLGSSFPVANAQVLELSVYVAPGGGSGGYRIRNLSNGAQAQGVITTNLPTPAHFMNPIVTMFTGATASANISISSIYLEEDF